MADEKLRDLTETTTPVSTHLAYLVVDPDGTPLDRKVEVGTLLGNLGAWCNLAMNSPGQIVTDGVEPQWWDDSGSATITDEDCAGEGIEEITERCFKVVTIADDHYGYQTLTFANESLLDAGETVVSFSCWVWCDAASTASIGIYGTNLGLEESSQHAGDSAWHLLTVENITLNAADASIQLRLIVDTDTAYFTKPMLNPGSCAMPWLLRGIEYRPVVTTAVVNAVATADVAWSDLDCTAATHPLAVAIDIQVGGHDNVAGSYVAVCHHDDVGGGDTIVCIGRVFVAGIYSYSNDNYIMCDDGQNIRYMIDGDGAMSHAIVNVNGYWRWVP